MDVAAVTEKLQFLLHSKVGKKLENNASSQGRMSGKNVKKVDFIYFKSKLKQTVGDLILILLG